VRVTDFDFRFLAVYRPQHRDQVVEQRGQRLLERKNLVVAGRRRHSKVVQHWAEREVFARTVTLVLGGWCGPAKVDQNGLHSIGV